jgi:pyruvate dehydrogenase E1 component beta subunit
MPSCASDVLQSYRYATTHFKNPVISIEHRFLYDLDFRVTETARQDTAAFTGRVVRPGDDLTIVATSYMVQEAQRAACWLADHGGPSCQILDPLQVSSLDHDWILDHVRQTGRLVVAATGWSPYGLSAEICRGIAERDPQVLKRPVISLGMAHAPCPTSHVLEDAYYPHMGDIVDAAYTLCVGPDHDHEVPTAEWARQQRKTFRGPF